MIVFPCYMVVTLTEPAKISFSSEPTTANETDYIQIGCSARGLPAPVFTWTKTYPVPLTQGELLLQSPSATFYHESAVESDEAIVVGSFLTFQSVLFTDGGQYTCTTSNSVPGANASLLGSESATVILNVQSECVVVGQMLF